MFGSSVRRVGTECVYMTERTVGQFGSEVAEYETAMDSLHETASRQSDGYVELDETMAALQASIAEMHDAVGEYGEASAQLDEAVVSLGETASAASDSTEPSGHGPAAAD